MQAEQYQRVREAFLRLRELDGPARAEALVELRSADPAVHDQLVALLAADLAGGGAGGGAGGAGDGGQEPGGSLERAVGAGLAEGARDLAPHSAPGKRLDPGDRVGPYTIEGVLGEGGFGTVYAARQDEPVRRMVALKILKAGMDTHQVVARFEQERQALAILDHPGIARVFDAGATPEGRPYFAMELVEGEPIDRYCRANLPSLDARLDLLVQICSAVQHAHTKGLIHRDIKPGNVLVSMQDGAPRARVIDFGIAKATQASLTDKSLQTELHQLMGTPQYMSPEQAEGSADIDTRTDVYALGVLLYELLTGVTPFAAEQVRAAGLDELRRMIREDDPVRPSTRLATTGLASHGAATTGASAPTPASRQMASRVRGELDWITMKALEKDRRRRYESPSALAADIERYLAGEAVQAAPPSRTYRMRKFVRRHRAPVTTVGAVMVALLVGVIAFAWQAHHTGRQRDRAVAAQLEADKVATFQEEQLSGLDAPSFGVGLRQELLDRRRAVLQERGVEAVEIDAAILELDHALTGVSFTDVARAVLDQHIFDGAIQAIETSFEDSPLLQARLLQSVATPMREIGLLERAIGPQAEALKIRRRELGPAHADVLASMNEMANLQRLRGHFGESRKLFEEVLDNSTKTLGEEDRITLAAACNVGMSYQDMNQLDLARPILERTLEAQRRVLAPDHDDTLATMNNLARVLNAQGEFEEALGLDRQALAAYTARYGELDRRTMTSRANLASGLYGLGRLDEAAAEFEGTLESMRRGLGNEHPDTLLVANNLGFVLIQAGRIEEGEAQLMWALQEQERSLGQWHNTTLQTKNNLGVYYFGQGRMDEAIRYLGETVEGRRAQWPDAQHEFIGALFSLGGAYHRKGDLPRVRKYWREAWTLREAKPAGDPTIINLGFSLAWAHMNAGDFPEAERVALEHERRARENLGDDHQDTKGATELLNTLYTNWHAAEPDAGHDTKAAQWAAKAHGEDAAPPRG